MNCPPNFYDNCRNNQYCPSCKAGGGIGTEKNLYSPLEDIGPHPMDEVVDTSKVKANKRKGKLNQRLGYKAERDIFIRLGGIHNHSSQGYDGTLMGYRVEYKVRDSTCKLHTKSSSTLPTKAEWDKAQAQGNRLLIVEDHSTGIGTVTMSLETFEALTYDARNP